MSLDQIVNVQISRETTAVQRQGFGVALFVDQHKVFPERFRIYESLQQIVDDGFPTDSASYLAASLYFGQEVSPTQIVLGRQANGDTVTLTCDAAAASGITYTVTVTEGAVTEIASYTTAGAESAIAVAAGVTAAINAFATLSYTADDTAADGTLTLTPDVAATDYGVVTSSNISVSVVNTQDVVEAVQDIDSLTDLFYGVATYSHLEADILAIAQYIETRKLIYGYSTSDASDITTALTGIMAQLEALNYARSFGIWDEEAGTAAAASHYPEMAWIGIMFPTDPGSATWMFKTLAGVENRDAEGNPELSPTQALNVLNKNGNTYERIGGVDITREGKVAEGEYIDVIRGVDWLDARMTERIYSRLVNLPKIPYTDAGVAIITTEIRAQLDEAIANGFISGETPYVVTAPIVSTISINDKANRLLPDIEFEATLASAIHAVTVKGRVVL